MSTTIVRPLPANLIMEHGAHNPDGAMCLLEMTAWMAGEPWSYRPQCACPVLAAWGAYLWDSWPSDDLARLAPYAERLIGTRSSSDVELRRAYRAADWAVRRFAVEALRMAGLEDQARTLQELSPVVDADTAARAAREAAGAAGAARAAGAWAGAAAAWAARAAGAAGAARAAREAAAEAAAWAAEAAAWAAGAAAAAGAEASIWDLALLCFDDLLSITEPAA